MKKLIAITLIACSLVMSSAIAENLPDAPSVTRAKSLQVKALPRFAESQTVVEPNHKGRTIALIAIVGGLLTTGLVVGLLTRGKKCPSMIWYEGKGYPYDGTPNAQGACPDEPPGLDPERR